MQEPRPDQNLGFLVHDVARLMRVAYDRRARSLGLTRSQWWVLNNLYFNEGITQSALADLLDVEKPTLGRLLDRLEVKGWITRQADRHDRRAKRVYLTGEVQAVMRALRGIAAGLRNDALEGMDARAQRQLFDSLLLIKANLLRMNENGSCVEHASEGADVGAGSTIRV
jgi:MarR family transcriptional regulator, transcriptional regulator for hemolysin